jgi:predicted small secreted protein
MFNPNKEDMNKKPIKAFILATLFAGAFTITACNTGTDAGETNTERSDIEKEGSMNEGYTSEENQSNADTLDPERHYDDAEGAVHAGDGKTDGVDREDVDKKP